MKTSTTGSRASDLVILLFIAGVLVLAGCSPIAGASGSVLRITYSGNGNTGGLVPEDSKGYAMGATATLAAPGSLARTGYRFWGWNPSPSGAGINYTPGATLVVLSDYRLYARWIAENNSAYTVERYRQDAYGSGYTLDETECFEGETGSTVSATAKSYAGLYENTDHPSRLASGAVKSDGSLILRMYYDRTVNAVSFDTNGGSAISACDVRYDATIQAPETSLAGHSFAGWYKDAGFENRWSFATDTVRAAMTLFAKWTDILYKVSFDTCGGSAVSDSTGILYGQTVSAPAAPTRAGYSFAGWFKEAALAQAWSFGSDTVKADTVLYAKWTANTDTAYKVQHYKQNLADDGYSLADTETLAGTTAAEATATARTYEGFSEATTAPGRVAAASIAGDGSLVLRLYYDRLRFTVTFNTYNNPVVSPLTGVKYGSLIIQPSGVERQVYNDSLQRYITNYVDYWYIDNPYYEWNFAGDTVTVDITLEPKWASAAIH